MTSLVSWAGIDSRGPASIYIASDSRISWGLDSKWDMGRKVFAGRSRPEVFGYVGDVVFTSLLLGQIADAPASPTSTATELPAARFEMITNLVKVAFDSLPLSQRRPFKIAYAHRCDEGMKASFWFASLSWSEAEGWQTNVEELPKNSDTIVIWGSGSKAVQRWKERWNSSSQGETSRAIFSAFCDAVGSMEDPLSGGAPQLVGLYRVGSAKTFGVIQSGKAYVYGLPAIPTDHVSSGLEWRDHLFQRCDVNGPRIESAQSHHSPKGLGGHGIV